MTRNECLIFQIKRTTTHLPFFKVIEVTSIILFFILKYVEYKKYLISFTIETSKIDKSYRAIQYLQVNLIFCQIKFKAVLNMLLRIRDQIALHLGRSILKTVAIFQFWRTKTQRKNCHLRDNALWIYLAWPTISLPMPVKNKKDQWMAI